MSRMNKERRCCSLHCWEDQEYTCWCQKRFCDLCYSKHAVNCPKVPLYEQLSFAEVDGATASATHPGGIKVTLVWIGRISRWTFKGRGDSQQWTSESIASHWEAGRVEVTISLPENKDTQLVEDNAKQFKTMVSDLYRELEAAKKQIRELKVDRDAYYQKAEWFSRQLSILCGNLEQIKDDTNLLPGKLLPSTPDHRVARLGRSREVDVGWDPEPE